MGRKGNCGRKNRGLTGQYKHFSIFCTKEDWDNLNFLADGENKTVSRFVADTCLSATELKREYTPTSNRIRKSLCILMPELEKIKAKAEDYNLSLSNFIFSVI